MKTWAKVGIGCLVVLLAACVISIVMFIFAGAWVKGQINKWTGGVGDMAADAKAIEKIEKEHPFTPPADGQVDEARLQAYIAICGQVKEAMAPYDAWLKEHERKGGEQKKGDWGDVKTAMKMTSALMGSMRKGMEEHQMSSQEFHWIEGAMREASMEVGSGAGADDSQRTMIEDSIKDLESQMAAPDLGEEDRTNLQGQVNSLRSQLAELGAGEKSHNRELFEKYAAQLKATDLKEFGNVQIK
jgi:hypothetical protein